MGRPSVATLREFEATQRRIAEWWTAALNSNPSFELDSFEQIKSLVKSHDEHSQPRSDEEIEFGNQLSVAIAKGKESAYRFLATPKNGKTPPRQQIYKLMKLVFDITFKEFTEMADRLDEADDAG